MMTGLVAQSAMAGCTASGAVVNCTTPASVFTGISYSSAQNDLKLNVTPTASIGATLGLGAALSLTGTGVTVNNAGTIDPSVLGLLSLASSGVVLSNAAGSNVTLNNQAGGTLKGMSGALGLGVTSISNLNGMAVSIANGSGGVTTLTNAGTISSTPLLGVSLLPGNTPLMALYGGAQARVTNEASGVINGRVALQSASGGNTFLNAGTITGSVSMGTNSTNTFTAVTGSTVNGSGGLALDVLNVVGLNLAFATAGVIDGGAGGNNTLVLQNSASGSGSGITGNGSASAGTYINFNNLTVNSGTWDLGGALVSGQTTLNGGLARFDNSASFGSGTMTVNGGALQASATGLSLNNNVTLNGTLGIQGANNFTLGGVLSGNGGLTKSDAGVLTLAGSNSYSGSTSISAGGLLLTNAQALGNSTLRVDGAATLESTASHANNVVLNDVLTLPGSGSLGLTGVVSGSGALVKSGNGGLLLSGTNSYSGGTRLNAGSLVVGSDRALGSGVLTVNGAGTLSSNTAATLANSVQLNAALNLDGGQALGLAGIVSGTGRLIKNGTGQLSLSGNNAFGGGVTLNAGTLSLGNANALGSGTLTVGGASTLASSAAMAVGNAVQLNNLLTLAGNSDLILNGAVSGAFGGLVKNGAATLTLNGNNSYGGGTQLNAGSLVLGNANALGTGALSVTGAAALSSSSDLSLANAVQLGATLSLPGSQALILNGALTGSGSLNKNGSGTLTLDGANSYSGGSTLTAGTLRVGNASALGSGALTVNGAASLESTQALSLANDLALSGALNLGGSQSLTLAGVIGGTGSLRQSDSATLTLGGANTYSGGTRLEAGTLLLGNDQALGTGALLVANPGAVLGTSGVRTLQNAVQLNASLDVETAYRMALGGVISGNGGLVKGGSGVLVLNAANSYGGGTTLNAGGLLLGNGAALGSGTLNVNGASSLEASQSLALNNQINLGADLSLLGAQNLALGGDISGSGRLIKTGNATLSLSGSNALAGGIDLEAGTLRGTATSLNGDIRNGAALVFDQALTGTYSGSISGTGSVQKTGSGSLLLDGSNSFSGGLGIIDGVVQVSGGSALADTLAVNLANTAGAGLRLLSSETLGSLSGGGALGGSVTVDGGATLGLGGDNRSSVFAGALLGSGNISKTGSGNLLLSGTSSNTGTVSLDGGSLTVDGTLASNVTVNNGSRLGGVGSIGGAVDVVDGHLAARSGQTLSLGSLTLGANANLDVALGSVPTSGLVSVASDLTLGGTLNVSDAGGMGQGLYRLFDYGGLLSGSFALVNGPGGYQPGDLSVLTNLNGQVNLLVQDSGNTLQFWNGSVTSADGSLHGGSGTWVSGTSNWTNAAGALSQTWNEGFAIFGGAAGNVTVVGNQQIDGLQFAANGYQLIGGAGGALELTNASGSVIRVDPNAVATLGVAIGGSGLLEKRDLGTLILTAPGNSYSGGTRLSEGVLQVSADAQLGSGALAFNGGTLRITGDGFTSTARGITLGDNGGGLDIASASNTFTLGQTLSGTGTLRKDGLGSLRLDASNGYSGGTLLNAGRLITGNASALGSGALTVSGNARLASAQTLDLANAVAIGDGVALTVDGSSDLGLGGIVSGLSGRLIKEGSGTLTLSGANTYAGGTTLRAGSLLLDNAQALGGGSLTVDGAGTLDTTAAVARLTNAVTLNDRLTLAGSNDLSLAGPISGSGGLTKNGAALLTLERNNDYSGETRLNAGAILLGADGALGSGLLRVNGSASLLADTQRSIANRIELSSTGVLQFDNAQQLNLDGVVAGSGALDKNGSGTLLLGQANAFSGGTTLRAGTLRLGNGQALGTGALHVAGAAALDSTRALSVGNDVQLDARLSVAGTQDLTLSGVLSGNGGLLKQGIGSLTLAGSNSHAGDTTLAAGRLVLANAAALGNSRLNVTGASTLDSDRALNVGNAIDLAGADLTVAGQHDLILAGALGGSGTLIKAGTSALTLTGSNGHAATRLQAGSLILGNAQALGNALTVSGAGSLDTLQDMTLAQGLQLDQTLTLTGSHALELAGAIAGSGDLIKLGSAELTLGAANAWTGNLVLVGGGLSLGDDQALGSGELFIEGSGTRVTSLGDRTLGNRVRLDQLPEILVGGSDSLTLNGEIEGAAGFTKTGSGTLALGSANLYGGTTTLTAGTLVLGNAQALGTSNLAVTANANLSTTGAMALGNAISLANGSRLTLPGSQDLTLDGVISGNGGLDKSPGGQLALNAANSYSGGTRLAGARLLLGDDAALGAGALTVQGDSELLGSKALNLGNGLILNADLTLPGAFDLALGGNVSGSGALIKTGSGALLLGGSNSYSGGTQVQSGSLTGTSSSLQGSIDSAAGTSLTFAQNSDGTFAGSYSGAGSLTKTGNGVLTLNSAQGFSGDLNVLGGTLRTQGDNRIGSVGTVNLNAGTLQLGGSESFSTLNGFGRLLLEQNANLSLGGNLDNLFAGVIDGNGSLHKVGASTLTLTGSNTHSGAFSLDGGTLRVDGTLASSQVTVSSGTTLTGNGTLTGNVDVFGTLQTSPGNALLALGSLSLESGSNFNVGLGAPNGGANLVSVNGDLHLGGSLNITDIGGYGYGVYRLFGYGGTLSGHFDQLNSTGGIPDSALGLQTLAGEVNLLVGGDNLRYWNGTGGTTSILGGNGTWADGSLNWLGATNLGITSWNDNYALFAGAAGTVSVEGAQHFSGLQFITDGYNLVASNNGQLIADASSGATPIRVDGGVLATIGVSISGSTGIDKHDGGTLVLAGNNTYTGGTTFTGGIVRVTDDNNLGDASGALTFNGGRLEILGNGYQSSARSIVLQAGGGGLDIAAANNSFSVAQPISGSGALGKYGDGTLLLANANGYSGGTQLFDGTLVVGNDAALGSGTLAVRGDATLDSSTAVTLSNRVQLDEDLTVAGSSALTFDGVFEGNGRLIKRGASALALNGNNAHGGGTWLEQGTLVLGNANALGRGDLIAGNGTAIDTSIAMALGNGIELLGDVTFLGSNDLTLGGAVAEGDGALVGTGRLIKTGNAQLTLNGDNRFSGGTELNGGTLILGSDTALGSGTLSTAAGTALQSDKRVRLVNQVNLGGLLTIAGNNELILAGALDGPGGLLKTGNGSLTLERANTYQGGTELNAGTLILGSDSALGSAASVLGVTGAGTLQSTRDVSVANAIELSALLSLSGDHALTLNGVISGSGGLRSTGNGSLILNAANTYSGGTELNDGALILGNAQALGAAGSTLTVSGAASLDNSQALNLAQNIQLDAPLTVSGSNPLALSGNIDGAGSLIKDGLAALILTGSNGHADTRLQAGSLVLGSAQSLGDHLTVTGSATLDTLQAMTLAQDIELDQSLTLTGSQNLVLAGVISDSGDLIKLGSSDLLLGGANSLSGTTRLRAGSLSIDNDLALGSGALAVEGSGTRLTTLGDHLLGNQVHLGDALEVRVSGSDTLTLAGVIDGAGAIDKTGSGTLLLGGSNLYSGGTTLAAGTLGLGNALALGAGALSVTGDARLDNDTAMALGNAITLGNGARLSLPSDENLTLYGVIGGSGGLDKQNAGVLTLNGANGYGGGTTLNGGTLQLGDDAALGTGLLTVAGASQLTGNRALGLGNGLALDADLTLPGAFDLTLAGDIGGGGGLIKSGSGALLLGGNNSYSGGTGVQNGSLIGDSDSLQGAISGAAGTLLRFDQASDGLFSGTYSGAGDLSKTGSGTLTLNTPQTFSGLLSVLGGRLATSGSAILANAGGVTLGSAGTLALGGVESITSLIGSGRLLLDTGSSLALGGNQNGLFAGNIDGGGSLQKVGSGTLTLSGTSTHSGTLAVQSGTLRVDGSLASGAVNVASGATLSGNGVLGGAVSVDGTLLATPGSTALSVGSLTLGSGATFNANLGLPGSANSLVDVQGALQLGGALSVTDAGGFGYGVYRLFNYAGTTPTGSFASISSAAGIPVSELSVQNFIAGQVNLLVGSSNLLYWNGTPGPIGSVGGGNGSWGGGATNWLTATTGADLAWNSGYALFGGTPGSVSVLGQQSFTGMQFLTDGYQLNGGTLLATAGSNGSATPIRVDAGVTATIASTLAGNAGIDKRDGGTLILSGTNTYSGGTTFSGGVTQVSSDANLGAAAGALTFNGGTLQILGDSYQSTTRNILLLASGGTLDIASAGNTLTLGQDLGGPGSLSKQGAGTLVLNGSNGYNGGTRLYAGALVVGANDALGSGALDVLGDATLDSNTDVRLANLIQLNDILTVGGTSNLNLAGVIQGSGELIKQGPGSLILGGNNTFSGGMALEAGTLILGSSGALGSGALSAAAGTSIGNDAALVVANALDLSGAVTFLGSDDLTLNGVIGDGPGTGTLVKEGPAVLVLNGANTYSGGTLLNGGTLIVGNAAALGSGALTTAAGTTLDSNTSVNLLNDINLGGLLTLAGNAGLMLSGDIAGTGPLVKNGNASLTLAGNNSFSGDTMLNAGTLVVGSDSALGLAGNVLHVAGNASLQSDPSVTLANAIDLGALLSLAGNPSLTLDGTITGGGGLLLGGPGSVTLNGANTYTGGTQLDGGTLVVGNDAALGAPGGTLSVGGAATLDSNLAGIDLAQNILLGAALSIGGSHDLSLSGDLGGTGSLIKNGLGDLLLAGSNSYSGGTQVNGGGLIGNSGSLQGNIGGAAGTRVEFQQGSGVNGTYAGVLSGGAELIKTGAGTLILSGANTYSGGTDLQAGTLVGDSSSLQGDIANSGTLVFQQLMEGAYAGQLSGNGTLVKDGAGTLILSGNSSGFGGITQVDAGQLQVDGSLGNASSQINVGANGSLGGGGKIGGNVTLADNAHLIAGTNMTPLRLNALQLSGGSILDFQFGLPNAATTMVEVAGDLTLDGTLNINDAGGMGTGIYQMFSYGGTLTDNGLVYGNLPSAYSAAQLRLQKNLAQHRINLVVQSVPGEIQYWNGDNSTALGSVGGGDGTWTAATDNWTDVEFSQRETWASHFAVFDTRGGNVTLDGVQNVTGLQFLVDGYRLVGDDSAALNTTVPAAGGHTLFRVESGATAQIDVAITGNGGLDKRDGGTLILTASNSYGGGTHVVGGVLQVRADEQLGQAGGALSLNGGTLRIAGDGYSSTQRDLTLGSLGGGIDIQSASNVFSLDQGIDGSGALVKYGNGVLELTGDNSYSGGTLIAAGTLRGDSGSLQGLIDSEAGTRLEFRQSGDGQFTGSFGGAGTLVKNGSGSLTLSSANSHSGGTELNGGTLIGDSSNLQGAISSAASTRLQFNQTQDGTFGGLYSGAGQLVKNGNGTLTLSAGSSYSGGTQVNGGRLVGDSASLQGAIQNNATLVFDQSFDGLFAGALTGSGTLIKQGDGDLLMTQESDFSGNVIVADGGLFVGAGPNSRSTLANASLLVQSGGQLMGAGTVGSVTNAGMIATNRANRLRIAGNLIQQSSGWTSIELHPEGNSALQVDGSATLAGTLQVLGVSGYSGASTFTLLNADQGIIDRYQEEILPDTPLLDLALVYTATQVNLSVSRSAVSFASQAVTPNQRAVAGALDSLPSSSVAGAVAGLGASEIPAAYDALSGEIHASTASALIEESRMIASAVTDRLRQSCSSGGRMDARALLSPSGLDRNLNEPCGGQVSGWSMAIGDEPAGRGDESLWGQTLASRGKLKGDGNTAELERRSSGILFGFDQKLDEQWRVGVAAGYAETTLDASARGSKSDVDTYHLAAYSSYREGNFNARFGASYAMHEIDSRRDVAFSGFSERAKAGYDAHTAQVFGELSYVIDTQMVALEPFVGLSHSRYRSDTIREKGGDASLRSDGDQTITQSTVGLRAAKHIDLGQEADLIVRGSVGWQHAFGSTQADASMRFAQGGDSFKVEGAPMARDAALVGAGVEMAISERSRLSANYAGQFSDKSRDHTVSLTYSYRF
ncbi:autotransporter-associated beta strand repeat-containing protein [Pseudomonas kuykendallii]|uniref:Autotransporter-associated beta strand repeat-containing protein n=1 Tax=Pseudomonas kuykendallii TaxID=1007099 RepID=A0A1H3GE60_9PSED|nr:autotransporter-associated beta strand repeat-containing protein [Pseudomonas kuykendallii]